MSYAKKLKRYFIPLEYDTIINEFDCPVYTPISPLVENLNNDLVHDQVEEIYSYSDGFNAHWNLDETGEIGGRFHIPELRFHLMNDQSLIDQCDMDSSMDERLRRFRVIDTPTMNTMVGYFVSENDEPSESLYFYTQGAQFAKSLDINFSSYLDLAMESKFFYYWQQVLIDIQRDTESPETKKFKEWMPKIFTDFNWEAFVEKYNSLRISLRK